MAVETMARCLFCQSPEIREASFPRSTYFNGKKFDYFQCKECQLVFINPLPSADDYTKMYAKSYHNEFYFKGTSPDYSRLYALLEKNSGEKSILDYGCGDGSFVNFLSGRGYTCTGVEYDPELVNRLRARFPSIDFYTTDEFNSLDKGKKFETVYLGDVLEHMDN